MPDSRREGGREGCPTTHGVTHVHARTEADALQGRGKYPLRRGVTPRRKQGLIYHITSLSSPRPPS